MDRAKLEILLEPHPLLYVRAFGAAFEPCLGVAPSPHWLCSLLNEREASPLAKTEELRSAMRQVLRHGGYRPTGRGKPSSEYLARAAGDLTLASINPAVDSCNAVSLHSGIPISVVDQNLLQTPLCIALGREADSYVFDASGQTMELAGLICLFDAAGPCANPVKDSQRTKTHAGTRHTLSILWGSQAFRPEVDAALAWYLELHARLGATTELWI